uniref:L1 transposable element RRM domain-containing protein n=1 Tax=Oreochromis niloticus TaxID=8128 RepID=A0A669BMT3_ORENI
KRNPPSSIHSKDSVLSMSSRAVPSPRDTSKASQSAAGNDAILAAIAKHGAELSKITSLMDGLKKSVEGRLDAIDATLTSLQKKYHESERRFEDLDEAMSANDSRLATLEASCKELQVANTLLKAKVNDLEGRSRRLNMRIVGVKEGDEKAHRSLRPKPQPNERPHVIIAKVHNDRDVFDILRLSRQRSPLLYRGDRVSIFPDYTAEVSAQRQALASVRKWLTDAGAKCSLRFPAKLQVEYNNTSKTFMSANESLTHSLTHPLPPGSQLLLLLLRWQPMLRRTTAPWRTAQWTFR